ncbi:MAG: peptide ABC transporter substrate-binding protein [Anaerolineae bacterium]
MSYKKWAMPLVVLIAVSLALTACPAPTPPVAKIVPTVAVEPTAAPTAAPTEPTGVTPAPQAGNKVTLHINLGGEPQTLDPSLVAEVGSIDIVENLFLGLTDIKADGSVAPELATAWSLSADRLTYTFKLRDDVSWVRYTPTGGVQKLGPVTAPDVVYGVKRTCDPRTASTYAYVDYIIAGCKALNTADAAKLSAAELQALVDGVGASAPDAYTVQLTVNTPAAYFLAIAGMWVNRPQYRAVIEEKGERWTEPGSIVTNGPYTLVSWFHDDNMVLEKNPFWYGWSNVSGNIERIEMSMLVDSAPSFAMYEADKLDTESVPLGDIERVKTDPVLSKEFYRVPAACTVFVGFTNSKPPMDNVLVRKALSAAIDRQGLIENVLKGGQISANTFAPSSIFGNAAGALDIAPWTLPIEMGGWGYDKALAQARQWLAEAGYPDGKGFPTITFLHTASDRLRQIAEAIQAMWKQGLGINVELVNQEGKVFLTTIQPSTPLQGRSQAWYLGWCADYPDENNWVHEVFNTNEGVNYLSWEKDANAPLGPDGKSFNQLTKEAQEIEDPAQRQALYHAAEKILSDDAAAFAPLYYSVRLGVTKPYLQRTYPSLGGEKWYTWVLDWNAKQKARGK